MTTEMEKIVFKKCVLEQADYLRFVGHKVRKVLSDKIGIENVERKHPGIEFDYYMYDEVDGWIRLNTGDVYMYINKNGGETYTLSPVCEDIVYSHSYDEFVKSTINYDWSEEDWAKLREYLVNWDYFK